MKKIVIIVGTRPEAIKLLPVYFAGKDSNLISPILVSTGQHKEMLDQIFGFFGVKPDLSLSLMRPNQSLDMLTSVLFKELSKSILKLKPDLILVQGDTTTAMVAAMIGFYNHLKVAHVEAGLRTYNKQQPFPEEVNRRIITLTSDIHFTPTKRATDALIKEGVKEIYQVGNTVIDSLQLCQSLIEQRILYYKERFEKIVDLGKKLVLITGHRRESFGLGFNNICQAISIIVDKYPELQFIYPVHLNPEVRGPVFQYLKKARLLLLDPLPYDEMIFLMSQSNIILTDSGGIQEEGPSLNVPIIVMRKETERYEGIESGCAILAGVTLDGIVAAFEKVYLNDQVYEQMRSASNPYGDGMSGHKIVEVLKDV